MHYLERLNKEQYEAATAIDGKVFILAGAGSGKALLNSTKVLTEKGYERIDRLKVGDKVFGSDGMPHSVEGVFPQGKKKIIKMVFSDTSKVECCEEHLWLVSTDKQQWNVKSTREIITEMQESETKYYIPNIRPIRRFSKPSPFEAEMFQMMSFQSKSRESWEKGLFLDYALSAPYQFRKRMLQDAWRHMVRTDNEFIYTTNECYESESVVQLVQSMGGTAYYTFPDKYSTEELHQRFSNGTLDVPLFTVHIQLPDRENTPLRYIKEIIETEDMGEMTCISVDSPDHLFVIENCILTHNTSTLTARTAYMVEKGIDANEILLLTFTNKAANEMKSRIVSTLGAKAQGITACTFHSFCAMFIRKNSRHLGLSPDYTILDSPDMMDALGIAKEDFLNAKKKEGKTYSLRDFPKNKVIGRVYEAFINNCVDVDTAISTLTIEHPELKTYRGEVKEILRMFKQYKAEHNLLDYNDLLFYTEKLLSSNETIRAIYDEKYKYISCDEYQDTNTVQNKILELLTRDYPNLAVVGDDNQSIYAFRYANIDNILGFEKRNPDCKTVVLDTNYRSSQEILDCANAVMSYATEGKEKHLKGLFRGNKPQLVVMDDTYDEADFIMEKIKESPYDLEDIAVICRSASQSYVLEQKLNMAGIPYNKFGGIKFMEKAVIKDLLAFLKVSVNIKDEIAMFRILQLYPGIGKTYARKIVDIIATEGYDAVYQKYKKRNFGKYIEELGEVIETLAGKDLEGQMDFLVNKYYKETVSRSIAQQNITDAQKSENYQNLEESMEDAKLLMAMAGKYRNTTRFLNDIILDATAPENDGHKLNITTIHSAKGLEYDMVFIMDCIEGMTPRCPEGDPEDPEELRCMYVAMTRAKKELYFLVPKKQLFKGFPGVLSHFLNKNDILNTMHRNVNNAELHDIRQTRIMYF